MEDKELLIKLVTGLKTLDESQFKYEEFVSEYDKDNHCGTVCCAWGWVPAFVPESGVRWFFDNVTVFPSAYKWKTLKPSQVDFMFYGEDVPKGYHSITKFGRDFDATLAQVINRIEYIINLL